MEDIYTLKRKRKKPEIVMAPLIDMAFTLLVFFLLTTTLAHLTGIDVKNPKAVSSQLLPRKNILITVTKDREIFLEDKKMEWKEFKKALASRIASSPSDTVVINTDVDSKLGPVVDVMDEARKSGAQRISIATVYEKKEED